MVYHKNRNKESRFYKVGKRLRKKENWVTLIDIFMRVFILFYLLVIIYVFLFLSQLLFTVGLTSFIEYAPIPNLVYYAAIISFIIIIIGIYFLVKLPLKAIEKYKKLKRFTPNFVTSALKKINIYLIVSLVMMYIIIIVGLNIYQEYYKNDLPFSFEFGDNDYNLTILSNCKSNGGLSIFTEGDEIVCDIRVNSKSDCNFYLNEIVVNDNTYYTNDSWKESNMSRYLEAGSYLNEGSFLENISFKTQIKSPVLHHLNTSFRFDYGLCQGYINPTIHPYDLLGRYIILNSTDKKYIPVTREMYENVRNQRLAILVLIFSVGLVSVLTSVKNLKDIIEGSNEVKF